MGRRLLFGQQCFALSVVLRIVKKPLLAVGLLAVHQSKFVCHVVYTTSRGFFRGHSSAEILCFPMFGRKVARIVLNSYEDVT